MDKPFVKREMRQYELLRIIFQLHTAWDHHRDPNRRCGRTGRSGAAQGGKTAATAQAGVIY